MSIIKLTPLDLLEAAVAYYQDQFEYVASTGTHEQLVEINSKLTTARLALYDYRYVHALLTSEMI